MTTEYVTCTNTAKEIRKSLKVNFPGVKFSVRSDSYANGASIRVSWTDGPAKQDVELVARQFAGASFDGMTDMKSYHTSLFQGRPVHWGADYVFCDRVVSEAEIARLRPIVEGFVLQNYGELSDNRYHEIPVPDEYYDRMLVGSVGSMIQQISNHQARR